MKLYALITITCLIVCLPLSAQTPPLSIEEKISTQKALSKLTNLRYDSNNMLSAGQPNKGHFESLQTMGLSHVIDLLPGDRRDEANLLESMELVYNNVAVEWTNPSLQNFTDYVRYMKEATRSTGLVLTHCKLNWRGAVFTYLYRVTQLKHDEKEAKAHMLETWKPNRRWQRFIDDVKRHYDAK